MGKTILTVILAAVVILAVGCGGNGGGYSEAEVVKVEATRQAVTLEATRQALDLERQALDLERDTRRQAAMDPFVLALPWVILLVGLASFVFVGWRLLQVYEARLRVIRRQPEEGEPILSLGRGERFALPLRSAGPYADLTRGQERATMRQQVGNLALAGQAAETVKARSGSGDVYLLSPEKRERTAPAPSPVRVLQEPTPEVAGWVTDVERALLPEVVNDDTSD